MTFDLDRERWAFVIMILACIFMSLGTFPTVCAACGGDLDDADDGDDDPEGDPA